MHLYDEIVGQIQRPEVTRGNLTNLPEAFYWPERAHAPGSFPGWLAADDGLPADRPFYIGEYGSFVYNTIHEYAAWGGEGVYRDLFVDGQGVFQSAGQRLRMQNDAYRWCAVDGISPWVDGPRNRFTAAMFEAVEERFRPVKAVVRERDCRFYAGDTMTWTLTVFNDQYRSRPLRVTWSLHADGKVLARQTHRLRSIPGELERLMVRYRFPQYPKRYTVLFRAVLHCGSKQVDTLEQSLTIYPRTAVHVPEDIVICDPTGALSELRASKVAASVESALERPTKAILVTSDAHPDGFGNTETAVRMLDAVRNGLTVILLRPQGNLGYISKELSRNTQLLTPKAYIRVSAHPVFRGLTDADFQMWRGDNLVSREDFIRLTSAEGVALMDCGGDFGLRYSPLMEIRRGRGRIILCQLLLTEKLAAEPIAAQVLRNLMDYAVSLSGATTVPLQVIAGTDEASVRAFEQGRVAIQLADVTSATGGVWYAGGDAALRNVAADALAVRRLVLNGGTVILHGLTTEAQPYLDMLLPVPIRLTGRQAQHEQLEKATDHPLLSGINHSDLFWQDQLLSEGHSVPPSIVTTVLQTQADAAGVQVLLREPRATHPMWNAFALQQLAGVVDSITPIQQPGAALIVIPYGRGVFVLDQVCWHKAFDALECARRYIGALLYHLGVDVTLPQYQASSAGR